MAHLLLIDDDAVLVPQQVRQAFPPPLYRVVVAQNGNHGVELVRRAPPDVVLLDLHLSDRHGLEVYRSIRAIDARIPVIFIRSSAGRGVRWAVRSGGPAAAGPYMMPPTGAPSAPAQASPRSAVP